MGFYLIRRRNNEFKQTLILANLFILFLLFTFLHLNSASAINCTTSSCHVDIKKYKKLHGPNKVNGCIVCHRSGSGVASGSSDQLAKSNLPKNHPQLLPILPQEINATYSGSQINVRGNNLCLSSTIRDGSQISKCVVQFDGLKFVSDDVTNPIGSVVLKCIQAKPKLDKNCVLSQYRTCI